MRRLAKWVRRHKLLALTGVLLGLFVLYLPLVPFLVLEQSRSVLMNCAGGGNCMTELLGPRDRDDANVPVPSTISVAAAPGLQPGTEIAWDLKLGKTICAQLGCTPALRDQFQARAGIRPVVADYVDPVSHIASIGAFAPVGGTGLVVVVATPRSAVRELTDRMLKKARAYLGAPMLLGVLLLGALLASLRLYRPKAYASLHP